MERNKIQTLGKSLELTQREGFHSRWRDRIYKSGEIKIPSSGENKPSPEQRVVELCLRHVSVLVQPRPVPIHVSTPRGRGMTVPVMSPQIGPGALKNHEYESRHLARPRQKFPPRKSRRPSLSRVCWICSRSSNGNPTTCQE